MFERTGVGRGVNGSRQRNVWTAGQTQAIGLAAFAAAAVAGAGVYWSHDASSSEAAARSAPSGATAERPLPLRGLVDGTAALGGAREGNGPATADELVGAGFVVVTAAGRVQGLPYTGGGAFMPAAMP